MRDRAQAAVVRLRGQASGLGLDRLSTRLGITLLIVSAIFFAANFADKAWLSYQVAQQRHQQQQQILQVTAEIRALKGDLKYMNTRAYYLQAARDLGFVQPGDVQLSIQVPPAPPASSTTDQDTSVRTARKPPSQSLLQRIANEFVPGL